jgi:hypothetical protein
VRTTVVSALARVASVEGAGLTDAGGAGGARGVVAGAVAELAGGAIVSGRGIWSVSVATGFLRVDGNSIGVTTMTIAVSRSARRVRLSIRTANYGTGSYPPGRNG